MTVGPVGQWWLAAMGHELLWARLRERESGVADILDCDGRLQVYESMDIARAALLDAGYRAFDGLDDDDASELGFELDGLAPPDIDGDDDNVDVLRGRMVQRAPQAR